MSVDALLAFAVSHYVIVGLVLLCLGIGLNLVFSCGSDIVEAIRHPKLN